MSVLNIQWFVWKIGAAYRLLWLPLLPALIYWNCKLNMSIYILYEDVWKYSTIESEIQFDCNNNYTEI